MSKPTETDRLAKILATMMERTELDRVRDKERRVREEERRIRREEDQIRRDKEKNRREEEQIRREERRAKETRDIIEALRKVQPAVP